MNDAQRAELIDAHRPIVRKAAAAAWPRVRDHVELEELIAFGDVGLVDAARRWDPAAGAPFGSFAWYRVQGAILDGLRQSTRLPRRVWAQLSALRAASELLEARAAQERAAHARGAAAPRTEERLRELKDAIDTIQVAYVASVASLDEIAEPADPAERPDEAVARRALRRRIAEAVATLPERERAIVEKHYFEGKDLVAAGAELGISKSWASRVHAQAVDRLRKRLAARDP